MIRVPFENLLAELARALLTLGFEADRAELCARLFAETTRDGVYTHGMNRFPRFIATIRNGSVDVGARAELVQTMGALERWDGHSGPGNLNAYACMERAIALARQHGIGCVALARTNHWMRGGSYGWQAAEAGAVGICWTNTLANLPPWGGLDARLGNNPLVMAAPRSSGPVVLDMAVSQFSYGTLEAYSRSGRELPVPGGFDEQGELTRDAAAIERSKRALPIGYWKGSGLSMMLDLVAAVLSGGNATRQIPLDPLRETGLSQVFIAMDARSFDASQVADGIIEFSRSAAPVQVGRPVRYPGEQTLRLRAENMLAGVPVEEQIWSDLLAM